MTNQTNMQMLSAIMSRCAGNAEIQKIVFTDKNGKTKQIVRVGKESIIEDCDDILVDLDKKLHFNEDLH
jgi:hypothetical protein